MKPKILIIKTGSTFEALAAERGDFDDWMLAGMALSRDAALVVDVSRGEPLPPPSTPAGVVVTGSHAMVTDREGWSEATAGWLAEAVSARTPILGVCYGHQLLAHALGGVVADNPGGRAVGTAEVSLLEPSRGDPLFQGLPERLTAQISHAQSVREPPPGAVILARREGDPNHAYVVDGRAWGVQFHPEFDVEIIRAYILRRRERLAEQGLDPEGLAAGCRPTPQAALVLRRFRELSLGGGTERPTGEW